MGNSGVVSISFLREDSAKCSHKMDVDLQHLGVLERHSIKFNQCLR